MVLLISMRAPKRAGNLGVMKLSDFQSPALAGNNTYNITFSGKHKTFEPKDSAIILTNADTLKWIRIHIQNIRCHIKTDSK